MIAIAKPVLKATQFLQKVKLQFRLTQLVRDCTLAEKLELNK
jgi:hypothetical protein